MPTYEVKTNFGTFEVDLNRPPNSREELMQAVESKIAQSGGQSKVGGPTVGVEPIKSSPGVAGALLGGIGPEPQMTQEEFTRARQQKAIQEPAFQTLARATIPTAATAASFVPGLQGIGAQTILGAAGTAANQMLGLEPPSLGEVAKSAAVPAVATGVTSGVKGLARGMGAALGPSITREAGVEAAAQKMKAPATSIARSEAPKASTALYKSVGTQPDVPTVELNKAINSAYDKLAGLSNAPSRATKYLEKLSDKYVNQPVATYADLTDELQLMKANADKAFAQKDFPTGRALNKARSDLLDEVDKISPVLKKANMTYRKEQATQEIIDALRKGNPGNRLRNIFETDSLIADTFTTAQKKEMLHIADELASIGTQGSPYSGVAAKLFNVVADTLGGLITDDAGRYLMRQTFKQGVTPQALAVLGQFGRAYLATKPPTQ